MATQYWAEGVWTGKWYHEQREAWMKQVREVQTWRQVRRPAGAVMCETRDLGIKWSFWHTLTFEGDRSIDMKYVCPKDVKKILLQQAREAYWKKWGQQSMNMKNCRRVFGWSRLWLRKKTMKEWTERSRDVGRKLFLDGGWVQKTLFDTGWSEESRCRACYKEEGTEKHRLYHCPE